MQPDIKPLLVRFSAEMFPEFLFRVAMREGFVRDRYPEKFAQGFPAVGHVKHEQPIGGDLGDQPVEPCCCVRQEECLDLIRNLDCDDRSGGRDALS